MIDDTADTPIHRVIIRVAVPPDASAVLPLETVKAALETDGRVVLGMSASREDEQAPSDPSELP
jgi:hypothetical protein